MLRGINRKDLFVEDEDKAYFLAILADKKECGEYLLPAYCLMDNHVHLLLQEQDSEISTIMKRINITYASYFNRKYERIGPLFQDRYRSEKIETEPYLLAVTRYIHRNPVKAGIVRGLAGYKWSSYGEYMGALKGKTLADTAFLLSIFGSGEKEARERFKEFMNEEEDGNFLEVEGGHGDGLKAGREIWQHLMLMEPDLAEDIKILKEQTNLSSRKLAEITELSKTKILNVLRER